MNPTEGGLVPSITALRLAVKVLQKEAIRRAQASTGFLALFGADEKETADQLQVDTFDLVQAAQYLTNQIAVRTTPVPPKKKRLPFTSVAVTLQWKSGQPETTVHFEGLELVGTEELSNPGWADRALSKYNTLLETKTLRKLSDTKRVIVERVS